MQVPSALRGHPENSFLIYYRQKKQYICVVWSTLVVVMKVVGIGTGVGMIAVTGMSD